jgi:hypothetical protein
MAKRSIPWADEFDWATMICEPFGCVVARSKAMFEIATIRGEGVSLVMYPHKTSASNHHARIRDNGSKDKSKAERVMDAMNAGEGLEAKLSERVRLSCTFSRKWSNPMRSL